jgi:glycosyltransferase involved in cell wall biosynthesis
LAVDLSKIAVLGDYLPRRCGIATFTTDLCDAIAVEAPNAALSVVATNDTREGYRYPSRVRFQIAENRLSEYRNAADFLNISNFEVVNVQHEYGIYGGPAGGLVLSLMRELRMPIVTTLHTVLKDPDRHQRRVTEEIAVLSDRLVVMSHKARGFLRDIYGVPESRIAFIPHGVADLPFVDPNFYKDLFGVEGKKVILTFGLISPNKGLEHVIRALPKVIEKHPEVVYIIPGATHPNIIRRRGEEYRFFLQGLVRTLDLSSHVIFHDRFVEAEELYSFLGSADICVTPYLDERQLTSGVLSLCVGAGKAVVSTPYWYAEELLADDRGLIVPFSDSDAVAAAITRLLDNDVETAAMRKRAYMYGREMVWQSVAKKYLDLFRQTLEERGTVSRKVMHPAHAVDTLFEEAPAINFHHLRRLTDDTGVLQHAKYTVPDRAHGYCLDDNARALIFAVRAGRLLGDDAADLSELAATYLSFLDHALTDPPGRFHNFMGYSRQWLDEVGSEDSHGRALWGLAAAATYGLEPGFVGVATRLFNAALPATASFTSPRAVALTIVGIHEYLRRFGGDVGAQRVREQLAEWLFARFRSYGADDWPWPEEALNYENARLSQALLLSGQWMNRGDMTEMALKSLDFLVRVQKSPEGYFQPVGYKGWYKRGGVKARFDQQPVEAQSMIEACIGAWHVTRDERWLADAGMCYEWFLGRNDLRVALYDYASGGCRDGLQADGVNQNEGAESTLAWLMAAVSMEEIKVEIGDRLKEPYRTPVAAGE